MKLTSTDVCIPGRAGIAKGLIDWTCPGRTWILKGNIV